MSDTPKPKLSKADTEFVGEVKLWKRTTHIVLLSGETWEITKVHAVLRYAILLSVKGREQPVLLQKHSIAYATLDLPKKEQEAP